MRKLLLLFLSVHLVIAVGAQKMIFAYGAACFIPVDKFNKYCDVTGGKVGYISCGDKVVTQ